MANLTSAFIRDQEHPALPMPLPRILVVEDEPSILENVLYALGNEGFEVSGHTTGRTALAELRATPHDLAILDVGLPDTSGFELCKEIRKFSDLPIIFLTARGAEIDRVVGLEIGGDDYVVKPFSPRELAARAKAVLRRCGRQPPPDPDQSGAPDPRRPFLIDRDRALVRFFGAALELSSTEYKILCTLCAHPGRVFSRSQLMDIAWEDPAAALERTVDAHVKSIRAKLRAAASGAPDAIVTHRGLGYSLNESWDG
ncbi:beta-lactam response regulator transcription factor BlrA [soil metagenome]